MQSRQKKINKTISISTSTHDLLDNYVVSTMIPASQLIEQLLSQFLLKWRINEKEVDR